MQVRMITALRTGPNKKTDTTPPGTVVDLDDKIAQQYIKDGIATRLDVAFVEPKKGGRGKE